MLRAPLLCLSLAAGLVIAAPAATRYTTDTTHSTLTFVAKQTGADVEGRFKQFSADITFSDADLAQSRFDVTIQTKSADTGEDDRDSTLRGGDLLAADKFPTAHFVTTAITRKAPGQYEATGKLTLRDVTREIRFPFTFTSTNKETWLKGGVMLNRLDYGVGQGEWKSTEWVGNEIKVSFALKLTSAAAT